MSASPSRLNFFLLNFFLIPLQCVWQEELAVLHGGTIQAVVGDAHPDPCHAISFLLSR